MTVLDSRLHTVDSGFWVQWNLDLTKSLRTGQICSLNRRVRYIENLDITNLRGNDQNVRYIEVIVND